jgi:DNA-binding PadR family transcriptional regulator
MNKDERDSLPLTPAVFHILLSLAAGPRHGYAIMKEVGEQTDGELRLGPGKLYYSIQRMLEGGLIEEITSDDAGKKRRPYRITAVGRRLARAEALRLQRSLRLARARQLLED